MKRKLVLYMLFVILIFPQSICNAKKTNMLGYDILNNANVLVKSNSNNYKYKEIRACWISYLDIHTYLSNLSKNEFEEKVDSIYKMLKDYQINTVIVQLRAFGDAIYPSKYFPWSIYISDERKPLAYDPLQIMIESAHKYHIRFEAWINPYRLSHNQTTTDSFKNTALYNQVKSFSIEYENELDESCISLDPSKIETNNLILCGICEIVSNYEVDGIHFDDYFYPPSMNIDITEKEKMEYVNVLIKEVYYNIKCIDKNCVFGISPAGNISYSMSLGTDLEKWLQQKEYVDYIMPQIYWSDEYILNNTSVKMFSDRLMEWCSLNQINMPMYVGLGLYNKCEKSSVDIGWQKSNKNLAEQYINCKQAGCLGISLFRLDYFFEDAAKEELDNLKYVINNKYIFAVGIAKNVIGVNI